MIKLLSIQSINFTMLKFAVFFIAAVFLGVIVISSLMGPLPAPSVQEVKMTAKPVDNTPINNKTDNIKSSSEVVVKNNQPTATKPVVTDQQLHDLQKELEGKNVQLAKLQHQLKSTPTRKNTEELAPSAKELKKMKDEIEFLKWALRSEVSSNHALTNSNNQLKQANASLNSRLVGK